MHKYKPFLSSIQSALLLGTGDTVATEQGPCLTDWHLLAASMSYTHTASLPLKGVRAHTPSSTYSDFEYVRKGPLTLDSSLSKSAFRVAMGRISKT